MICIGRLKLCWRPGGYEMKIGAIFSTALLLVGVMGVAQEPPKPANDACKFTVQEEPAVPSVTGPDDIIPLVYVVEQPDSPIEILSVNLDGTWLSVSNNRYTAHHCAKYQIRNRSDQTIRFAEIMLEFNGGGGFGATISEPISSGQTVEVKACNGGGHGSAPENSVKLLVSVQSISFGDCMYRPSVRIPKTLGVRPAWIAAGFAPEPSAHDATMRKTN
jgi:hypothetical protein